MKARVLVYPRREVLDPQAKAIQQALARLGFDDVVEVHAGKAFDIEVSGRSATAEARLRTMCEKLLANPVMESFSIELLPSGARASAAPAAAGSVATKGPAKPPGAAKPTEPAKPQAPAKPKVPAKTKAPAKPKAPAAEKPTAGTAGGKPVPAKSAGTTEKRVPAAKKGGGKGARS